MKPKIDDKPEFLQKADAASDYIELFVKWQRQEAIIAKLKACAEFYGNEMNYSVDDYHGISGEMRKRCVLYSDCEERNDVYSYAGKKARTTLAEVAELEQKDKGEK